MFVVGLKLFLRRIEPRLPSLVNGQSVGDAGYEKTPPEEGVCFFGAPSGFLLEHHSPLVIEDCVPVAGFVRLNT